VHHVDAKRLLPRLGRIADGQRTDVDTSASIPPISWALDDIHPANATPSATSSARPKALPPFAFNAATVVPTSSALRAQIETVAPRPRSLPRWHGRCPCFRR